MVRVSKLTKKFQITIPSEIRKVLNLRVGDKVTLEIEEGKAVIKPIAGSYTKFMQGLGAKAWKKLGGAERYLREERKSWK